MKLPSEPFLVDFSFPPVRQGSGGQPMHPRIVVLEPEISLKTFPDHPHLSLSGRESFVCAMGAHLTDWNWESVTTAVLYYLRQTAIWLLNTVVWIATREIGDGRWLSPDASHTALGQLLEAAPNGPCPCQGPNRYRDCCMPANQRSVFGFVG